MSTVAKVVKLSLVATALLLIPRRSSRFDSKHEPKMKGKRLSKEKKSEKTKQIKDGASKTNLEVDD